MIESSELIERWVNAEYVLVEMPEHERQRHWDMSTWGKINECGTIACAAGQCGLKPWFRERGFKLDFRDGDAIISNVPDFFGLEGASRIFYNTSKRPVETVIEEIRAYVGDLHKLVALNSAAGVPKIGDPWEGQGGIFAGARLGVDGAPDYFLIVGPEHDGRLSWDAATAWAGELVTDRHRDFALPDRLEQRALFDQVRNLFEPVSYWSSEQHAGYSDYAWGQDFFNGGQHDWFKDDKLRARAVRRLIIQ